MSPFPQFFCFLPPDEVLEKVTNTSSDHKENTLKSYLHIGRKDSMTISISKLHANKVRKPIEFGDF